MAFRKGLSRVLCKPPYAAFVETHFVVNDKVKNEDNDP